MDGIQDLEWVQGFWWIDAEMDGPVFYEPYRPMSFAMMVAIQISMSSDRQAETLWQTFLRLGKLPCSISL